ncbi:uncharacterized protein [Nicotiana tomentosiformis]|uniref:uncharacterized protein n=1 Tax=Nicotiana tomentosiformis TaxID=4098 RepID=UPI00388CDD9F
MKANVVAYALSRKAESMDSSAFLSAVERPLAMDVQDFSPPICERIKAHHFDDPHLLVFKDTVQRGGAKEVVIGDDGVMRLQGHICVPNVDGLRGLILKEAHSSRYAIHPGVMKMYHDLKYHYWWQKMTKDIVDYVFR